MGSPLGEGAAAVIFDPTGRVLLVKENYDRRRWSLPGGLIEPRETPEEAALRETAEETGVAAAIDHRIGTYTFDDRFRAYVFRCRIVRGEPAVPTTGEIAEVRWAPPEPCRRPARTSCTTHSGTRCRVSTMSSASIFR